MKTTEEFKRIIILAETIFDNSYYNNDHISIGMYFTEGSVQLWLERPMENIIPALGKLSDTQSQMIADTFVETSSLPKAIRILKQKLRELK